MKDSNSLTKNIKNFRHGTEPLVRPIEDLNILPGIPGNSWFWVGHFESEGTITLDGKKYAVKGNIWLDRQFARPQKGMSLKDGYNCKWIWMNLQFDQSQDVISLWGVTELATKKEYCWATVLHPDGTQAAAGVNPMMEDASEVWESPVTNMKYPTRWKVQIPEWDAVLDVKSVMDEQEIVAGDPAGKKYEGASRFTGMYKGKEVTGYCCLELVGGWDK